MNELQALLDNLNINIVVGNADIFGVLSIIFLILSSIVIYFSKVGILEEKDYKDNEKDADFQSSLTQNNGQKRSLSWNEKLKNGLSQSNKNVWIKVFNLFSKGIDQNVIDEIEEILYGADLGANIVDDILEELNKNVARGDLQQEDFKSFLLTYLKSKFDIEKESNESFFTFKGSNAESPQVIMIVGVNGAGKTTTIGKLATKLTGQGAKVTVGACDTFRAAAVDQLEVWCKRAGADMIRAKEGANPSGVGYDALSQAISSKADYCILDTAGRLQNKDNLMLELQKSKNVLKKLLPDAPHEVILVIDAITGQNALNQAKEFDKYLNLTSLIFTKCDGSSKAGSAVGIVDKLKIPIAYIGVGENVEDLNRFDVDQFLNALIFGL